jgi:hypothetical protein
MKRILILALLAAGCASPLPQTPPAGLAAQSAVPEIRAGDSWVYAFHDGYTKIAKGNVTYRVSAVRDDTVTVEVQHDGRLSRELYTRGWNWREKPMANLQSFRYEPAYPALPFPLEAGKSWQTYVQATDPATGRVNRVRIDGAVLGWERVKVPAGEFDTLKVRRLVYAGNHDYFRSEEQIVELDWYAPRLGQIVKHVSSSGYYDKRKGCDEDSSCQWVPNDWNVLELASYRQQTAAARP